jgi:hypothetical protein
MSKKYSSMKNAPSGNYRKELHNIYTGKNKTNIFEV